MLKNVCYVNRIENHVIEEIKMRVTKLSLPKKLNFGKLKKNLTVSVFAL